MLSLYSKTTCPQHELNAIIAATSGYEERTLKKWHKITTSDTEYVHVIVSGHIECRRTSDDLCMFTVRRQCVFGLSAIFNDDSHIYGLACSKVVVRTIRTEEFIQLISEKNLWPQLSKVLAWYICLLNKRDDILVARNAYSIVREFLIEIYGLVLQQNLEVNVYDYIQEYTNLARSTIIKILSELKKGQYIVVEKGRLLSISALPEKY